MMSSFLPDIEENEITIGKFYWTSLTLSWDKTITLKKIWFKLYGAKYSTIGLNRHPKNTYI